MAVPERAAAPAAQGGFGLGLALAILLGGLALLAAAVAWGWFAYRRKVQHGTNAEPLILQRPAPATPVAPAPEPTPERADPLPPMAPAAAAAPSLAMDLAPGTMTMTLVNAALGWKVEIANRTGHSLDNAELAFDMISAHKELSVDDRTGGPGAGAEVRKLGQLQRGGVRVVDGVVRLPFPRIVPIWHGETALLMPLVRLRLSADGVMPVTRVILVGQPSPRDPATLQPFRLDLGPRTYTELARRAFA